MTEEIEDVPEAPKVFVVLAPGTIASDYALQKLNEALGQAQNEFLPATKDAENTYGGWNYTPLSAIVKAVRPALTKHHITVSQFPVTDLEEKTVTVYTRITHWDSGEWMQNAMELPGELALGKGGIPVFNQQTLGGSQTYGQKYAYKAICGIPDSEEMIDSTEEKGDLPSRKRSTVAAQPTSTKLSTQAVTQRQATQPAAAQPQGAQLKFIPPNGITAVIKRVKRFPKEGKLNESVNVELLGDYKGISIATCWHASLLDLLENSVGLEVHFLFKEGGKDGKLYLNIEDVLYVDGTEYVDGKPVVGE